MPQRDSTEGISDSSLNEAPQWYSAQEIRYVFHKDFRLDGVDRVCDWVADNYQKAFEKGFQLGQQSVRDGQPGPTPTG